MESRNAQAIIRLKELQAQIGGMRLALTTSCSNCDVESVVSLLKVINTGVAESIKYLEASQFKEEQEDSVEIIDTTDKEIQEVDSTTEVQSQINALLDSSIDRTMNLSNIPTEEEMAQRDIDALMSLAGYMSEVENPVQQEAQKSTEEVQESVVDKQSLNAVPIHFDSPEYNSEEKENGSSN